MAPPRTPGMPPRPLRFARYESAELLERYFRDRDPRDRDELVRRFMPLAVHLSRRYMGSGEDEDLQQVASLALVKAIERFDPRRGAAFTSFAVPTIIGDLKRYFRDLGWSVRVPRSLKELGATVNAARADLSRELGRSPTIGELAARCQTSTEGVMEALMLSTAHRADSLDARLDTDEDDARTTTVACVEGGFARAEQEADMVRLLSLLPEREQAILRMRFVEDLTQREIAERIGMSQMHVSRLIRAALDTLQAAAR